MAVQVLVDEDDYRSEYCVEEDGYEDLGMDRALDESENQRPSARVC